MEKQRQFNAAMARFTGTPWYRLFGVAVSVTNVALQWYLLLRLWPVSIGPAWQFVSLAAAYLLTDFVNGLVHLYMDNNDRYDSLDGPLVANFHLHHKTPLYKRRNLLVVYFNESGSKVWLVGYLLFVLVLQNAGGVSPVALYILVYTGILSSVAEVSHYLCHTSLSPLAAFLARIRLLLPKRHHARHHLEDNVSYAFLNGITDPLLNRIAAVWCKGYKQNTDLHYACYTATDADAR